MLLPIVALAVSLLWAAAALALWLRARPQHAPRPAAPGRVLAVLDGRPGSGKTTVCSYLGRVARVQEKDVDDFTQPIVNPGHVTARTPEGRDRRRRWLVMTRLSPPPGVGDVVRFVRDEISAYLRRVPADRLVVFCGLSRWGDYDLLPPEADAPRFLLRPSPGETAERSAIRALEASPLGVPTCQALVSSFEALASSFRESALGEARREEDYALVSDDGAMILRAILELVPGLGDGDADLVVSMYRDQPTVRQRLARLGARRFGRVCGKLIVTR